jgi:hypothetical protein
MHKEAIDKLVAAKDEEIKSLKEEIGYLRKQNEQLLGLFGQNK